jgi:hypothetical protein
MPTSVRLFTVITCAVCVAALAADSMQALQDKKAAPSVAGKWTMAVDAGPHGTTAMGLALQQDGRVVKGTFQSPHGDMPVEGEFADGALALSTLSSGDDSMRITFTARLKADGTLAGYMSSQMGDMTWTATRARD